MAKIVHQMLILYLFIFTNTYEAKQTLDEILEFETNRLFPFSSGNIHLLLKSVSSIYKSIKFFDSVVNHIDIDGLIGVRILYDQLGVIETNIEKQSSRTWTQLLANTIRDLKDRSGTLLNNGLECVRLTDGQYFQGSRF